jgi:hypothetical protein
MEKQEEETQESITIEKERIDSKLSEMLFHSNKITSLVIELMELLTGASEW